MHDDLAYRLSESISAFCRAYINQKQNLPIRSSEMGVLIYITKNPGVLAVDISEYFGIKKSSISSIIVELEKRGYIKRTSSKKDKRIAPLFPTEKGFALTEEAFEEYLLSATKLISGIGIERCEEFLKLLDTATKIIQDGGQK